MNNKELLELSKKIKIFKEQSYQNYKNELISIRNMDTGNNKDVIDDMFMKNEKFSNKNIKNYHSFLSIGFQKINQISNKIIDHKFTPLVLIASSLGALSGYNKFASIGVFPIVTLFALSLLSEKINDKIIKNNIEKIALKLSNIDVEQNNFKIREDLFNEIYSDSVNSALNYNVNLKI